MGSRRGSGNAKGKQLSQGVVNISLDSAQDNGDWEVIGKKTKNRGGGRFGPQNSSYKAWGPPPQGVPITGMRSGAGGSQAAHSQKPAGGRNARNQYNSSTGGFGDNSVAPKNVIPPPLDQGWNWQSRAGKKDKNVAPPVAVAKDYGDEDNSDPLSDLGDSDEDLFSDEFDSDSSEKSHETQKKSNWFKQFFDEFDRLSVDEVADPARRWHCPACKKGPGAIDWYDGLQPLKRHAETKGAKRVKLHRELAKLIDAELQLKGASVTPVGQVFGRWVALKDEEKNRKVIWPPMVLIMNTKLEQDEFDKWIGMGTEELLDLFDDYHASKARHSYGPQGHCGMSLLIFEASAMGHFEAERLHRHFAEQGFGRDAWERNPVLLRPGLIRQLYGFLPTKRDLDTFNQHCDDKGRLKFEIKSYREMVLQPTRQMSLDSEEVIRLKDKLPKEMRLRKDAEETNAILRGKIEKLQDENRILRKRITTQLEENKEEMILQEEFYKGVISLPRD